MLFGVNVSCTKLGTSGIQVQPLNPKANTLLKATMLSIQIQVDLTVFFFFSYLDGEWIGLVVADLDL